MRSHQLCTFVLTLPLLLAAQEPNITSTSQPSVASIAQNSLKSVVVVYSYDSGKALSLGSGFVASKDGKILTNYHVIAGADTATVKFENGAFYDVDGVVAVDRNADLVVLKLKTTSEFVPLRLGDASSVAVGDSVVAVGSPMGLEGTVSNGIVSAKRDANSLGLERNPDITVFQITAPTSPGSSGGALVNSNGDVIGVPFVQLVAGQNLNFAVPITYAEPLLTSSSVRPLAEVTHSSTSVPKSGSRVGESIAGTYTGVWQSGRFAASGAATMHVTIKGTTITADIFITGSKISSETLTGNTQTAGDGVWTAELRAARTKLSVKGIFRNGTFIGDYSYHAFLVRDHGRWIMQKN